PFFPLNFNPLLNASDLMINITYIFCGYCFLAAIILYFLFLAIKFKHRNKDLKKKENNNINVKKKVL
ncbi:MAG: hypothetical protein ACFE96_15470, partial [Candidatus Hermodarchaeota archaeon]